MYKLKHIIFVILFFVSIFGVDTFGQNREYGTKYELFDSLLHTQGLSINDIHLQNDIYDYKYTKLKAIHNLLDTPLTVLIFLKEQKELILNLEKDEEFNRFCTKVNSILQFKEFSPYYFETNLTAKEIENELYINIDNQFGFEGGHLIRQYITPVLQINALLKNDFLTKKGIFFSYIFDNSDLILFPQIFEKRDPVSLYKQKRHIDSLANLFFNYSIFINQSDLYSIGMSLYKALLQLGDKSRKNLSSYISSIKTKIVETPYGRIALGGPGNDTYEGDFVLIVDVGGDDTYNFPNYSKEESYKRPARILVDFSGNDTYRGGSYSLGGSAFGISILLDYKGNDKYSAAHFSIGSSLFGFGLLRDFEGNDEYHSLYYSQGAAAFGIGLLIDNFGDDEYICGIRSQGFGFSRGYGLLADLSGNDKYFSRSEIITVKDTTKGKIIVQTPDNQTYNISLCQGASAGYKNLASGGFGILFDKDGNDSYVAETFAQGAGYYYGLGALLDLKGNDSYYARQRAQATGDYQGIGVLMDSEGNDEYSALGESQGFASNASFAMLIDEKGSDYYKLGLPTDFEGNTEFNPSISIFTDIRGYDNFTNIENIFKNNSFDNIRKSYGTISSYNVSMTFTSADTTSGFFKQIVNDDSQLVSEDDFDIERNRISSNFKLFNTIENVTPLPEDIDSLFAIACASEVRYAEISKNAVKTIVSRGDKNVPQIIKFFKSETGFNQQIIQTILTEAVKHDSPELEKLCLDSINSGRFDVASVCSYVIAFNKILEGLSVFEKWLKSENWKKRATASYCISQYGILDYCDSIDLLLEDKNDYVCVSAAYSLSSLFPDDLSLRLSKTFEHPTFTMKKSVISGLKQNEPIPLEFITNTLYDDDYPEQIKSSIASLLPFAGDNKKALKNFYKVLPLYPDTLRKIMYESIINTTNSFWLSQLKNMYKNETNEDLILLLDSYFEANPQLKKTRKKEIK